MTIGIEQALRELKRNVPRQQFFHPIDRVIGDHGQDMAQVRLGVNAVKFGSAKQTVHRGSAFAARVRAEEHVIFSAQGYTAQRAFGGVIIDLDAAIAQVADQRLPLVHGIANSLGRFRFARHCWQLLA